MVFRVESVLSEPESMGSTEESEVWEALSDVAFEESDVPNGSDPSAVGSVSGIV